MRCLWRQGVGPDVGGSVRTVGRARQRILKTAPGGQLAGEEFVLLADWVVMLDDDWRRGDDARLRSAFRRKGRGGEVVRMRRKWRESNGFGEVK